MTSVDNMWVNVGHSQFHLITGKPQHLRGRTGLHPRPRAVQRLDKMKKPLEGTRLASRRQRQGQPLSRRHLSWGSLIRCHAPEERSGPSCSACPMSSSTFRPAADGIAASKRGLPRTTKVEIGGGKAHTCRTAAGSVFRETRRRSRTTTAITQVYVADFSGPYKQMLKRKMITQESNQHQYRFLDIYDPKDGKVLFRLEHEIRSMTHPLYARPMINRNPAITNNRYAAGYQDQSWAMPV
jgi:hypothetical protein